MPTTKTAISLDSELYERADSVADELNIPRSQLFAMALDEFIERRHNRQILAAIGLPPEQQEMLRRQPWY